MIRRVLTTRGLIAGLVGGSLLLGCGVFSEPGDFRTRMRTAEDGRGMYLEACASCHGAGGHGDGPVADSLVIRPPDLTTFAARRGGRFNEVAVSEMIDGRQLIKAHGPRDMPVWGKRFEELRSEGQGREAVSRWTTRSIVAYLESIQSAPVSGADER